MMSPLPSSPIPDIYRGTRALVLGGSGFIGACVVRALERQGAEVHVSARNADAARLSLARRGSSAAVHAVDLAVHGAGGAVVDAVAPDVVFNLVVHGVDHAERDAGLMARLNGALVEELCEALGDWRRGTSWPAARLVHAGSALEYGTARGHLSEDTVPQPTTDYGRTKLRGTLAIQEAAASWGVRAVVARLFTVYGPGEHRGRLLPSIREAARRSDLLPLTDGLQRRDFTYVGDVAEGLLRLGACSSVSPGAIVNLATGRLTPVREFAEAAARAFGLEPSRLHFGALPTRASEMCHDDVDVSRLRALTNWTPSVTIAQGLELSRQSDDDQR